LIRDVRLLLQLLFWYNAVLKALPEIGASLVIPGAFILNNRGLFTPRPLFADGSQIVAVLAGTVVLAVVFNVVASRVERLQRALAARIAATALIVIGGPGAALLAAGAPVAFEYSPLRSVHV